MEQVSSQLENLMANAPLENRSNSSQPSPARAAALITLIQKTRSRVSLPLLSGSELQFAVTTWAEVVAAIPDTLLGECWRRATAEHDWTRPFPVDAIAGAYKSVLADENERLESARKRARWDSGDTYICWKCEDTGYQILKVYCPTTKASRQAARPCSCSMTPANQRSTFSVEGPQYSKAESGVWAYENEADSFPCGCLFCKSRNTRQAVGQW